MLSQSSRILVVSTLGESMYVLFKFLMLNDDSGFYEVRDVFMTHFITMNYA